MGAALLPGTWQPLFEALKVKVREANPHDVANTLWAAAEQKDVVEEDGVYMALLQLADVTSQEHISAMKPQEFSNSLWASLELRLCPHPPAGRLAAAALQRAAAMKPQDIGAWWPSWASEMGFSNHWWVQHYVPLFSKHIEYKYAICRKLEALSPLTPSFLYPFLNPTPFFMPFSAHSLEPCHLSMPGGSFCTHGPQDQWLLLSQPAAAVGQSGSKQQWSWHVGSGSPQSTSSGGWTKRSKQQQAGTLAAAAPAHRQAQQGFLAHSMFEFPSVLSVHACGSQCRPTCIPSCNRPSHPGQFLCAHSLRGSVLVMLPEQEYSDPLLQQTLPQ